jgi:hypothetical protein
MNSAASRILFGKIKWMGYEVITSAFDFLFWAFHLPVSGMIPGVEKGLKRIVFVGELLPPRTPRMAKWIKRTGSYSTVLVCSKRGYVEKFSNPDFEKTFLFRNKWHLKRILRAIPDIYLLHSFAPKSYFPDIARKSLSVPFIHDMQDVYATYYGLNPDLRWLKKELPHEKACLEQADGVIGHSLEPNVAYRKYKTKKKPPNLFFPLYCDDDSFCENRKQLHPDDIHLVYAGGVAGSHRNPKQYGNIQFQNLILTLTAQKLHFHIYPSPSNVRADYEEYEAIAKENPFFHFHEPVAQQELAGELSGYHFGIHTGFVNDEQHHQSADKYKYCTTLKLFNFIEAGIPVIISKNLTFQCWILERFECGFGIERHQLDDLKAFILSLDYENAVSTLLKNRPSIGLQKHTKRLTSFYEKTAK